MPWKVKEETVKKDSFIICGPSVVDTYAIRRNLKNLQNEIKFLDFAKFVSRYVVVKGEIRRGKSM